jgi:hypothetical protein
MWPNDTDKQASLGALRLPLIENLSALIKRVAPLPVDATKAGCLGDPIENGAVGVSYLNFEAAVPLAVPVALSAGLSPVEGNRSLAVKESR